MGEIVRRSMRTAVFLIWCIGTLPHAAAQDSEEPPAAERLGDDTAAIEAADTRVETLRMMRREKAETLRPPRRPGTMELVMAGIQDYVEGGGGSSRFLGFEPKTGGLKRGAGAAIGLRFAPFDPAARLRLQLEAAFSSQRYWGVGGEVAVRSGPTTAQAYGRYRHMPAERFFGFGPDSDPRARSEFGLNEAVGGGILGLHLGSRVTVGARAMYIHSVPRAGRDGDVIDAADRFAGLVPSLETDIRHVGLGAWLEFESRDPGIESEFFRYVAPTEADLVGMPLATQRGLYALAEFVRYEDVGNTGFSFSRLNLQSQQFVPFLHGRNVFAFREYLTLSADGRPPLYMTPAIGGAYSIRGFDEFRFRDRHALLLNAEYRWQVWLFLDLALFVDAGQVFDSAADLSLGTLDGSYGAGLRLRGTDRGLARIDIGWSEEGSQIHIRLGSKF